MSQPPYPPYSGSPQPDPHSQPGQPQPGEQYPPAYPQSGAQYPPQPGGQYPPQSGGQYPPQSGGQYPQYPQSGQYPQPGGQYPQPGEQYPPAPGPYPPGYGQPADQTPPGYAPSQGASYGGAYTTPPPQPSMGYPTPVAAPPKKSKAGKIILIVLAAVLVLCGGGVAVAIFAFKDSVSDVVAATETAKQTRLVTPDTLAGRARNTAPDLQSVAENMVASMKQSQAGTTSTVAAFYGDPAKRDLLMVAGASAPIADPGKELGDAIKGLENSLQVTNMASIEPGPLGGVAKCGDADAGGVKLGVCVWADNGSLGVIGLSFKNGAQAEAEFQKIRGEVEQRS
jgi:hypothetical protein